MLLQMYQHRLILVDDDSSHRQSLLVATTDIHTYAANHHVNYDASFLQFQHDGLRVCIIQANDLSSFPDPHDEFQSDYY